MSSPGGKVFAPVVVLLGFYLSLELRLQLSSRLPVTAISVDISIEQGLVKIQLRLLDQEP